MKLWRLHEYIKCSYHVDTYINYTILIIFLTVNLKRVLQNYYEVLKKCFFQHYVEGDVLFVMKGLVVPDGSAFFTFLLVLPRLNFFCFSLATKLWHLLKESPEFLLVPKLLPIFFITVIKDVAMATLLLSVCFLIGTK